MVSENPTTPHFAGISTSSPEGIFSHISFGRPLATANRSTESSAVDMTVEMLLVLEISQSKTSGALPDASMVDKLVIARQGIAIAIVDQNFFTQLLTICRNNFVCSEQQRLINIITTY
jgi:hypothetical protein